MRYLIALLVFISGTAMAQTVQITVTPTSGVESVTPTITWTSQGVTNCEATGGWSGTKPPNGSETLPAIGRSVLYGLACTTPGGDIVISWTPPTENTNGTPLTDLAKYRLYVAPTAETLSSATPIEIDAPASTYTVSKPTGKYFVAVTAVNAKGVESALSNTPSKDVTAQTATGQAGVEVIPRPKSPAISLQ